MGTHHYPGEHIDTWTENRLKTIQRQLQDNSLGPSQVAYLGGAQKILDLLKEELSRAKRNGEESAARAPRTNMRAMALQQTSKVRVRAQVLGTSFEAAVSISPAKAEWYYRLVYEYLETYGPMTHEQLIRKVQENGVHATDSGLRARCSELRDAGWVEDTGTKRPTRTGHPAIVWAAVPSDPA